MRISDWSSDVCSSDLDLRARILEASMTRTEHNDENDTRKTIQRLAQLRAQKAKLLGFDTYAAYSLADQMAKTPENAHKMLTETVHAASAPRSEERRGGREGVRKSRSRWVTYAEKKRHKTKT